MPIVTPVRDAHMFKSAIHARAPFEQFTIFISGLNIIQSQVMYTHELKNVQYKTMAIQDAIINSDMETVRHQTANLMNMSMNNYRNSIFDEPALVRSPDTFFTARVYIRNSPDDFMRIIRVSLTDEELCQEWFAQYTLSLFEIEDKNSKTNIVAGTYKRLFDDTINHVEKVLHDRVTDAIEYAKNCFEAHLKKAVLHTEMYWEEAEHPDIDTPPDNLSSPFYIFGRFIK